MSILIILFVFIVITLRLKANMSFIIKKFESGNTLVFGKKRKGKDLLFQNVIKARKKEYFSNISYGYKYNPITLNELSVYPNTYNDLIHNTITKSLPHLLLEKKDIYISDGGNFLPSQYQDKLIKQYPSMPIFYSLQGHLYDNRTHVNYNGSFNRLWDKLREQADEYFFVLRTFALGPFLFTQVRYYELGSSAEARILPFSKRMVEGGSVRSQRLLYNATNGLIKNMWVGIRKRKVKYDTRYFRSVFFKTESNIEK